MCEREPRLQAIGRSRDFMVASPTWDQYDATNDGIYLMKKGSDLYKLAGGR